MRAWTSEDFLVGFRMSAYHGLLEGAGMTDDELVEVAQGMTAGGAVDLLSVSGGTGYTVRSSSVFVPGDELPENVNGPHAGPAAPRDRRPHRSSPAASSTPTPPSRP